VAAAPQSYTGQFLAKLLPSAKAAKGSKPAAMAKPAVLPQRKSVLKQAAKDAKAASAAAKKKPIKKVAK
jgi:excinuclease ABC subunit A